MQRPITLIHIKHQNFTLEFLFSEIMRLSRTKKTSAMTDSVLAKFGTKYCLNATLEHSIRPACLAE